MSLRLFYLDDVLDGYVIVEDVMVVVDDAVNENDLIVFCYVVGPLNATPVHITHNLFLVKDCYGCLSGVSIVASVTFFYCNEILLLLMMMLLTFILISFWLTLLRL